MSGMLSNLQALREGVVVGTVGAGSMTMTTTSETIEKDRGPKHDRVENELYSLPICMQKGITESLETQRMKRIRFGQHRRALLQQ